MLCIMRGMTKLTWIFRMIVLSPNLWGLKWLLPPLLCACMAVEDLSASLSKTVRGHVPLKRRAEENRGQKRRGRGEAWRGEAPLSHPHLLLFSKSRPPKTLRISHSPTGGKQGEGRWARSYSNAGVMDKAIHEHRPDLSF
jgi:hypothetical protein